MKILAILFLFLTTLPAFSSECSKFAAKNYALQHNLEKTHITVKKEHTQEFTNKIGSCSYPYIIYGWGDLKIKGKILGKKRLKKRITYTCLTDENKNPLWSEIYESR